MVAYNLYKNNIANASKYNSNSNIKKGYAATGNYHNCIRKLDTRHSDGTCSIH